MTRHDILAAVDLGSNSFHLQIGRVVDSQVYLLDALREQVQLGAGLTADKRLDRASQGRALEALGRFRERLRGLPRGAVRAVGTNALRVARNAPAFLREARDRLGFPIEVIAGREEARLIYIGVARSLPPVRHRRLVVDVGGGSTEVIVGEGQKPRLTESLYVGCISHSLRYFPEGRIDRRSMKAAVIAARQEFATIAGRYRRSGWQEAVGTSGSARTVEAILGASGRAGSGITREGLEWLRGELVREGRADPGRIAGLKPGRASILPGGCAILSAVFDELDLESMTVSDAALRHGVLYDLLGRVQHEDMREATVQQFMRRYHVDAAQAARVRTLALRIYDQLVAGRSDLAPEDDPDRLLLDWAARLAEIGQSIAHAQYHRHSAYVLSNADMPGFSRAEQQRLARVVLAHRGKLVKFPQESPEERDWTLLFALRLAATLARRRSNVRLPSLRVTGGDGRFMLELPRTWLAHNALTRAALEDEARQWETAGRQFTLRRTQDRS